MCWSQRGCLRGSRRIGDISVCDRKTKKKMVLRGDLRLSNASWCTGSNLGDDPRGPGGDTAAVPQCWLFFSFPDTAKATFLDPLELRGTMLLIEAGKGVWNF